VEDGPFLVSFLHWAFDLYYTFRRREVEAGMLVSIRIEHLRDELQTAECLTADCADNADKGRRISDYPRHPRNLWLNALAGLSVAVSNRGVMALR